MLPDLNETEQFVVVSERVNVRPHPFIDSVVYGFELPIRTLVKEDVVVVYKHIRLLNPRAGTTWRKLVSPTDEWILEKMKDIKILESING